MPELFNHAHTYVVPSFSLQVQPVFMGVFCHKDLTGALTIDVLSMVFAKLQPHLLCLLQLLV